METWKLLLGIAVLLAMVAAVVSLSGSRPSLPVLVGIIVILTIGLALTIRSFRFGQQLGDKMAEDRKD